MCPPGRPATAFYRRTVPPGWSAVGVLEELRLRRCAKSQGGGSAGGASSRRRDDAPPRAWGAPHRSSDRWAAPEAGCRLQLHPLVVETSDLTGKRRV